MLNMLIEPAMGEEGGVTVCFWCVYISCTVHVKPFKLLAVYIQQSNETLMPEHEFFYHV